MNRYFALLILALSFGFSSCTYTETVEPSGKNAGSAYRLKVTTYEGYNFQGNTRADAYHSLRIVVNLYKYTDAGATFVERQEKRADGGQTEITFNIDDKGKYIATLFADYIPSTTSSSNGRYTDRYYDTTDPQMVRAITGRGDFFNNENRDCFVGKCVFEKTVNSSESSVMLSRPTSRVTISTEDRIEGIESLAINSCSHIAGYRFNLEFNNTVGGVDAAEALTVGNENFTVRPTSANLFYFYTFAGYKAVNGGNDESLPALGELSFTITPTAGYKVQTEDNRCVISPGVIVPMANYKITAKGKNWVVIDESSTHDAVIIDIQDPDSWQEKDQSL